MSRVLSNLNTAVPASQASRGASRNERTATSGGERFDQMLEQSSQTRQEAMTATEQKPEKQGENKPADTSKQADDIDVETPRADEKPVDQVDVTDEVEDQIDQEQMALAASGAVIALQADLQQDIQVTVTTTAQNEALTATAIADVANPVLDVLGQSQSNSQTNAQEASLKQSGKDIADAMLRMLGISSGQPGSTQPSTVVLLDPAAQLQPIQATGNNQAQTALEQPKNQGDLTQTNDTANVARVSRALQNAVMQKGGTITIRMMPPELGQVRVDIQMHGGKVSANFQTEHQSVQTLMSREMSQLRQALEKQGLTVEKLEVTQRPASSSNAGASSQNGDQQTPSDGRSRGQYTRQHSDTSSPSDPTTNTNNRESFATQLSSQG